MGHLFTRRAAVLGVVGFATTVQSAPALTSPKPALLERTPNMDLGPFYPVVKPGDQDRDLTRVKGRNGRASGQVLLLTGQVRTKEGRPIAGALLEIWQADANGRYGHPSEDTKLATGKLDPFFQHYGRQTTDADGRYSFLTVHPAAYPGGMGPDGVIMRAPHIHFDVTGKRQRTVTAMYLPGTSAKILEQDPVLHRDLYVGVMPGLKLEEEMKAVLGKITDKAPGMEPGAKLCTWDIVLSG